MAVVENHVVDYPTGIPAAELLQQLTELGAAGWKLNLLVDMFQRQRRAIFVQGGALVEYKIVDYETGQDSSAVESDLDALGVDGWMISLVDNLTQSRRRAIMMRGPGTAPPDGGGGTGGVEEAPLDGVTYGRRSGAWNPALAKSNDELDGGSF